MPIAPSLQKQSDNHHCTCLHINGTGIMIEGPSGSGKTSLALGLLQHARLHNIAASFVCDDQAYLFIENNQLWAKSPKPISGNVEIHGAGIGEINYIEKCEINLVCQMVKQSSITRMPETLKCQRIGISLDLVQTPRQHEAQSVRIVWHKLALSF